MKTIKSLLLVIVVAIVFTSCQKQPTADFTASKITAGVDESITFSNNSTDADSYSWEFGDGLTSTDENATHSYTAIGTYSVKLIAYSKNEKKEDDKTSTITIEGNETGTFTDSRDGKTYKTVKIGNQWWMSENLAYKVDSAGCYCWAYDHNENNVSTYGYLYDWWTAHVLAPPTGWHLPNNAVWTPLTDYLGGESVAGGKMKETGTIHWSSPNEGATNSSGFTGLASGYRGNSGSFYDLGYEGHWWAAATSSMYAWVHSLYYGDAVVYQDSSFIYNSFSVRCVKD